jgi:hypothetical protein
MSPFTIEDDTRLGKLFELIVQVSPVIVIQVFIMLTDIRNVMKKLVEYRVKI